MADSSLTPLQLLLLMPRHEHSVTVRPDSGTLSVEKGPFLLPFLPIIAKVIATLLFRRMSNQKLNEAACAVPFQRWKFLPFNSKRGTGIKCLSFNNLQLLTLSELVKDSKVTNPVQEGIMEHILIFPSTQVSSQSHSFPSVSTFAFYSPS